MTRRRVEGHALVYVGARKPECTCGAVGPEGLTIEQKYEWHRSHKDEILAANPELLWRRKVKRV